MIWYIKINEEDRIKGKEALIRLPVYCAVEDVRDGV